MKYFNSFIHCSDFICNYGDNMGFFSFAFSIFKQCYWSTCNLYSFVPPQILDFPAHLGEFSFLEKLTPSKHSCKQPPNYDVRKHTEFIQSSKLKSTKHLLYFSILPTIFCCPTLPHAKGCCCAYLLISLFRTEVSLFGWFIHPGQTTVWKCGNVFPEPVKGCLYSSCQAASHRNIGHVTKWNGLILQ